MTQRRLTATRLITALSIGSTMIAVALPCLAQTTIYSTIVRPNQSEPTSSPSTNNIDSQAQTSQSNKLCYQVDENSKIYIRYKSGGGRYYPENNSQAAMKYPRCD